MSICVVSGIAGVVSGEVTFASHDRGAGEADGWAGPLQQ
jgi:hypothetical protein